MIQLARYFTAKANSRPLNLTTFFFLYIAQTIPMTFFSTSLQVMMRQEDFTMASIALLQTVKIPWVLKFLWSPLVDRHCVTAGDYKRVIIGSELAYAALILLLAFLDIRTDLWMIVGLIFLSLVASATQDIATDALAILTFSHKDKSLVNSMQSMGSFGGTLIGGGLLLMILHQYGWHRVIPFLCLFVLLALIPLCLNRKMEIKPRDMGQKARLTDFVWFFTRRSIWRQIVFLFLYYASIIGLLSVLRPYLVDHGYDMKEIGMMSGMLGTGFAFFVALGAGFVVRRIGVHAARIAFSAFTLLTTLYFYHIASAGFNTLMICIGIILLWSSYGMSTVVVYTSAMECVRPGREGTDFTIQTVITHLSGLVIALICGNVVDAFGFDALFMQQVGLASVSLLYVLAAFGWKKGKREQD